MLRTCQRSTHVMPPKELYAGYCVCVCVCVSVGMVCAKSLLSLFRKRPPGLIKTVLVFWSWVPLLPRLPPSSRSLRLFLWASILLHGPLEICLDLLPAAPYHPCKNGTHSTTSFTAQEGTYRFVCKTTHARRHDAVASRDEPGACRPHATGNQSRWPHDLNLK